MINATNATEVGNGIVFLDLEADTVFTLTYKNDVGGVIDFYDPVDTKDGLALGALKLKISRQGTVYFGASISDTVLNLSSTGTILTNNTAVNGVNSIGLGVNNINDADTSSVLGGYENVIDSLSRLSSIVSGDYNSLKGSDASSILSGKFNTISSGSDISSVSGGGNNRISAEGAFIGGGGGIFPIDSNSTTGNYSAILGGRRNYVTGTFGVVAGGYRNEADSSSFAAGELAKATHTNAFVWSDGSASTSSSGTHTFTTKATGGYNLYSDANGTAGVSLSSGSGTWASISDSTLKRNIREVNYYEVLDKLSELKISQWSYLAQDADIEHIGPMAQDFYRLFGLGDDNKHISTLDPDGVALAAIKALHEKNNELSDQNEKLEREIQEVKTLLQELIDSK
ncbi:MAG: hypothetical protein DWP97_06495 [Calditrichaeota bacterium]|nr:MAG: hypothetical protein DWP97_06495 [Calditrichota bacterium]